VFLAQPEILLDRLRSNAAILTLQIEVVLRIQCARNDFVSSEKDHIRRGGFANLPADAIIDGISGDHEAKWRSGYLRTKEQWAVGYLIEPAVGEQVRLAGVGIEQTLQLDFDVLAVGETCTVIDCGDCSGGVHKREQVAAAHLPEFRASVLDGGQVMRGH
jgi:hypothetical protein